MLQKNDDINNLKNIVAELSHEVAKSVGKNFVLEKRLQELTNSSPFGSKESVKIGHDGTRDSSIQLRKFIDEYAYNSAKIKKAKRVNQNNYHLPFSKDNLSINSYDLPFAPIFFKRINTYMFLLQSTDKVLVVYNVKEKLVVNYINTKVIPILSSECDVYILKNKQLVISTPQSFFIFELILPVNRYQLKIHIAEDRATKALLHPSERFFFIFKNEELFFKDVRDLDLIKLFKFESKPLVASLHKDGKILAYVSNTSTYKIVVFDIAELKEIVVDSKENESPVDVIWAKNRIYMGVVYRNLIEVFDLRKLKKIFSKTFGVPIVSASFSLISENILLLINDYFLCIDIKGDGSVIAVSTPFNSDISIFVTKDPVSFTAIAHFEPNFYEITFDH